MSRPQTWAEKHGVSEDWPAHASTLVACRQGDDYYEHAYSWHWVYRYDGMCPYHPDGFKLQPGSDTDGR